MDPDFAALAPKIHLHCHLEGTLAAETFVELAGHYGLSTRFRPGGDETDGPRDPERVYAFADFREFLLIFAAVSRALATPGDYARLAREFVANADAQRVRYGELFVSPSVWRFFHPQLDLREALHAIAHELRAATQGEYRLIVDVTRNFGATSALETARFAADCTDLGVIGIGLGGDEARFPAEDFADVFAFARSRGLHTVAHAGEAAGASSVRAAIEALHVQRIGHGVRAIEDDAVVALLRERQIPLEICPTSNECTGVVARGTPHPLLDLDAAGVLVTIDADDPMLFATSLEAEYRRVAQLAGEAALARFIANAVEATFLDSARKATLRAEVGAELTAARRTS